MGKEVTGEMKKGRMKSDLPERTFQFARRVVKLCQFLDEKPGVSRTLANQLLRSGTSIGANVEEGQASQSEADFISKYSIACKEARETHYWLRLLAAVEILPSDQLAELETECNELIAILTSIVKKKKSKQL
jgi:four helix bundle protein